MPSLKSIRKRIISVKNTQKITKAMKMVAAAKLRRAQSKLQHSRGYGKVLEEMIKGLAASGQDIGHPLFQPHIKNNRVGILIFTSDRGLCGGFNSNLLRHTERFLRDQKSENKNIMINTIGRKANEYLKARKYSITKEWVGLSDKLSFSQAQEFANLFIDSYLKDEVDEFYIAFNRFKSAISFDITIKKIIPIDAQAEELSNEDIIWEPDPQSLLGHLLPRYIATQIYLAHLESYASELGSRMTAMDNATSNASDMISALTLKMNRARQAAITTELMDIVNGSEAMK